MQSIATVSASPDLNTFCFQGTSRAVDPVICRALNQLQLLQRLILDVRDGRITDAMLPKFVLPAGEANGGVDRKAILARIQEWADKVAWRTQLRAAKGEHGIIIEGTGEPLLLWEDLTRELAICGKTLLRWRKDGLLGVPVSVHGRRTRAYPQSHLALYLERKAEKAARGEAKFPLAVPAPPSDQLPELLEDSFPVPPLEEERAPAEQATIVDQFKAGKGVAALSRMSRLPRAQVENMVRVAIDALPLEYIPHKAYEPKRGEGKLGWRRLFEKREDELEQSEPREDKEGKKRRKLKPPPGLPSYLAALYDTQLLSPERERWLFLRYNFLKCYAQRLRQSLPAHELPVGTARKIFALAGQASALRQEIASANLRLVVALAKRQFQSGRDLFDLVSDGNLSLMKAIEKFDVGRGFKFSTYATWAVRKNFQRSLFAEAREDKRVHAMDEKALAERALAPPLVDSLLLREESAQAHLLMQVLKARDRRVVMLRFGIGTGEPMTLNEVGKELGRTRERVRQIELKAIARLREAAGVLTEMRQYLRAHPGAGILELKQNVGVENRRSNVVPALISVLLKNGVLVREGEGYSLATAIR